MKRLLVILCAIVVLAVAFPAAARDRWDLGPGEPGRFDFYALSLTWVPEFCATHNDPNECGRGLGFALHGLWPESTNGYHSNCSHERLPADVRASREDLYASPGLIDHEWKVHGTCSGLGPAGFLETTSNFLGSVTLPPDLASERSLSSADAESVKAEIVTLNPELDPQGIVLICEGSTIKEMHVCLDKAGAPRACVKWEQSESNCR